MKKNRYENIDTHIKPNTVKDILRWQKERRRKKKDMSFQVPFTNKTEEQFLQTNRSLSTITWIGHSTFLIQMNGRNILFDPVWAKRMGFQKRLSPPGIPIDELPAIDLVLISHSHYDHLHDASIKKLKGNPMFVVPIGLAKWFHRKGIHKTIECAWWEEHTVTGLKLAFVPAQHWTKRTLTDTNCSHWGGWVLQDSEQTIYFAGDSGYFNGFEAIGKTYDIDYCLMPIGAYEPEWFMSSQHVTPEDAVKAFIDTNAKTMIPMHYGTFMLADDTPKEALDRLLAEWEKRKLDDNNLKVMKVGETISI
ncbi:MBL fold metallo-hydrolase [Lentibacillus sp. N15]|uniref:MBL fold metallo-hydrolase n=1 Tax=Lentibacillus songyuanensis TaxID=3136161 RepID=UPI0031BAA57E